jgi:phage terminase large subunit
LGAVKAMAYNKAPQPVTDASKSAPAGKFQKNFGKDSGIKANKILNQLESTEDKNTKLLNEEFNKINHLMGYTKKTQ